MLFLFFFLSESVLSKGLFELGKQPINKKPLHIKQTLTKLLNDSSNKKGFITVDLNLAKNYKAYNDIFKVSSPDKPFLKISKPKVSPLFPYIDKFNDKKKRLVIKDNATMRFSLSSPEVLSGTYKFLLTYQACTKNHCLLPQDIAFNANFPIIKNSTKKSLKFFT